MVEANRRYQGGKADGSSASFAIGRIGIGGSVILAARLVAQRHSAPFLVGYQIIRGRLFH